MLVGFFLPWYSTELVNTYNSHNGLDFAIGHYLGSTPMWDLFLIPLTTIFIFICWYYWQLNPQRTPKLIWCIELILMSCVFCIFLFTALGVPSGRGPIDPLEYGFCLSAGGAIMIFVTFIYTDIQNTQNNSKVNRDIILNRKVIGLSILGCPITIYGFLLPWRDVVSSQDPGLENASGFDIAEGIWIGDMTFQIASLLYTVLFATIFILIICLIWISFTRFFRDEPVLFRITWGITLTLCNLTLISLMIFYFDYMNALTVKIGLLLSIIGVIVEIVSLLVIGISQQSKNYNPLRLYRNSQ